MLSILFIIDLCLLSVSAESHSLRYYFTTTSPGLGQPSYYVGGYVDDIQLVRYTSNTDRVQPLLPGLEESMERLHWVNQTNIAQYYKKRQQNILDEIKALKRFNATRDGGHLPVFQVQFWCEISGDNATSGYEEFAANGEGFIVLDTHFNKFIPLLTEANPMTQDWNYLQSRAQKQKSYMEHECIMWLKRYLDVKCVKERLKTVTPEVKIIDHKSDGVTKLHCWVNGFYPQLVDVKWMINKTKVVPSDQINLILPNPDGTYQTVITVVVSSNEKERYFCRVDHSSLNETLQVEWDPRSSDPASSYTGIIVAVIIVVALVGGIAGYFLYKRLSGGTPGNIYTPTPNREDDSSNPNI